jgi:hypothetical protein
MVNRTLSIISFLLLSGCGYMGQKSIDGLPRKRFKGFESVQMKTDIIDTNAVYKLEMNFFLRSKKNRDTTYERDDQNKYRYTSYLKFYSSGKVGLFIIHDEDTARLTRSLFDPQKAKMGYYKIEDSNRLYTRSSTIGASRLKVIDKSGYIKKDSIFLKSDKENYGFMYVRKAIDPQLLSGWKPDW